MISFTVNHPHPDRVAGRFVALVNRLLPPGWRFSIEPTPRVIAFADPLGITSPTSRGYALQPGFGRLRRLDEFGTLEMHADAWRRRFRVALSQLAGPGPTSEFELLSPQDLRANGTFFDSYFNGLIDIGDFERTTPIDAAQSLVHALEESHPREANPTLAGFHARHAHAIAGLETMVAGGTRLENEILTRPRGIDMSNPPLGRAYEAWTPYLLSGGAVRAVVYFVREQTLLRSRLAGFRSLEDYRRGVPV